MEEEAARSIAELKSEIADLYELLTMIQIEMRCADEAAVAFLTPEDRASGALSAWRSLTRVLLREELMQLESQSPRIATRLRQFHPDLWDDA